MRSRDVNVEAAEAAAKEIGEAAYAVQMDVTKQDSIDAAIAAVVEKAGKLDILINNAALFDAHNIVEITRESYDKLFSVNVAGTLFTMQAAAKQMIAQGHGGKIINMASQAGRRGESLVAVYCATKAAVISLTQSAGPEPDPAQDQRQRHRPGRGRRRALGACRRHVRQAGRQEARPEESRGRQRASPPVASRPPMT